MRLAGGAGERVEAPDPAVHGLHGIARADVHLHVAGPPTGHDHVMSSRQELHDGRPDGSGSSNHDDAHESPSFEAVVRNGAAPRHRRTRDVPDSRTAR